MDQRGAGQEKKRGDATKNADTPYACYFVLNVIPWVMDRLVIEVRENRNTKATDVIKPTTS